MRLVVLVMLVGPVAVVAIMVAGWLVWGRRRWTVSQAARRSLGKKSLGVTWIDVALAVAAIGVVLWVVSLVLAAGPSAPMP